MVERSCSLWERMETFANAMNIIVAAIGLGFSYSLATVNLATVYTNDMSMKVYYIMALFMMTASAVSLMMLFLYLCSCSKSCVGDTVPASLSNFMISHIVNVLGNLAVSVILIKYDMSYGLPNEASTDGDKLMRLALFAPSQIISILTVALSTAFGLAQIINTTSQVQVKSRG